MMTNKELEHFRGPALLGITERQVQSARNAAAGSKKDTSRFVLHGNKVKMLAIGPNITWSDDSTGITYKMPTGGELHDGNLVYAFEPTNSLIKFSLYGKQLDGPKPIYTYLDDDQSDSMLTLPSYNNPTYDYPSTKNIAWDKPFVSHVAVKPRSYVLNPSTKGYEPEPQHKPIKLQRKDVDGTDHQRKWLVDRAEDGTLHINVSSDNEEEESEEEEDNNNNNNNSTKTNKATTKSANKRLVVPTLPQQTGASNKSTDKKEEEQLDDSNTCIVCQESKITTVNVACGHMVVCIPCANSIADMALLKNEAAKCPTCNTTLEKIIVRYFV